MFCPKCGKEAGQDEPFCPSCGVPLQGLSTQNTSGMGDRSQVPPEVGGWNWGAFLLGWIWGIGNSVWISLVGFLIPFLGFIMAFVLGAKGSEWAWKARKWESIGHFQRTQRAWALWGLGIWIAFAASVVFIIVFNP